MTLPRKIKKLREYLANYSSTPRNKNEKKLFENEQVQKTETTFTKMAGGDIPEFSNEFWTSRQRQASSLHEVSYRACFKPQLPRFFIQLLTNEEDTVYDPFSGRGTTAIEAALSGRRIIANDVNPLSEIFTRPRLSIPSLNDIHSRLERIKFDPEAQADIDLSMFYDPGTESEIVSLKNYISARESTKKLDVLDMWIRMVATNRLTGHSSGFFSVYTLPPNQAASPKNQEKINAKRKQKPQYRDIKSRILKKSQQLMAGVSRSEKINLSKANETAVFLTENAGTIPAIKTGTVNLTVTSPPFLNIVNYAADNWLRCWFNGYRAEEINKKITSPDSLKKWIDVMNGVFSELYRITRPGGWVAFEVGEVKKGKIKLDKHVVPLGLETGFKCAGVLINKQEFTKTSNIWGIKNNTSGTNTNRIVVFYKS